MTELPTLSQWLTANESERDSDWWNHESQECRRAFYKGQASAQPIIEERDRVLVLRDAEIGTLRQSLEESMDRRDAQAEEIEALKRKNGLLIETIESTHAAVTNAPEGA